RYETGETTNDPALAEQLAELAQIFVLDAFGSAHRAHASTVGVADHVPSAAGPLLVAELEAMSRLVSDPPRPFTVILGGAKVSDKLPVMEALLPAVDAMLVGGGMCFTMLAAQGYEIGDSLFEPELMDTIRNVLDGEHGGKVTIPSDVVAGDRFASDAGHKVVAANGIEDGWMGLDIGPETAEHFASVAAGSGSVFWNGPMGVFEWEAFRAGTATVASAVARSSGFTVAGGGDSVAAVRLFGIEDELSHLSTGGGAGLELLEGKLLPGVAALEKWA
ncbi:MAG TPA: phosphoglycerate kinase, partial [Actinobacteria bacterium]|nr:phosphoglycerate kinase [Actinomycetota bacterium]